jgi:hypothetical protein
VWKNGSIAPPFLTSALGAGEWSLSRPFRFTPGESVPGTHLIGGWVCPKVDLDVVEWIKVSFLVPGIEPQLFIPHPDDIPTEAVGLCVLLNNNQENICFKISNLRYYAIETERILLQFILIMTTYGR